MNISNQYIREILTSLNLCAKKDYREFTSFISRNNDIIFECYQNNILICEIIVRGFDLSIECDFMDKFQHKGIGIYMNIIQNYLNKLK